MGQKGCETAAGELTKKTMGAETVKAKKTKADARAASRSARKNHEEKTEQGIIERAVDQILINLSERLADPNNKTGNINEFLKLVTFQRELEDSRPKEIIVRWVEPSNA